MKNISIKKVSSVKIKRFANKEWELINRRFNLMPRKETSFLGVYLKGKLVGYSKVDVRGKVLEIRHILVHNRFTGMGIGSEAMKYIEEIGRKNKCKKSVLKVPEVYRRAIKFYKKHGYKKDSTLRNYYYGRDWYYMVKEL